MVNLLGLNPRIYKTPMRKNKMSVKYCNRSNSGGDLMRG